MQKWGFAPTSISECGALGQIAAHVILERLLHHATRGYLEMLVLDD